MMDTTFRGAPWPWVAVQPNEEMKASGFYSDDAEWVILAEAPQWDAVDWPVCELRSGIRGEVRTTFDRVINVAVREFLAHNARMIACAPAMYKVLESIHLHVHCGAAMPHINETAFTDESGRDVPFGDAITEVVEAVVGTGGVL